MFVAVGVPFTFYRADRPVSGILAHPYIILGLDAPHSHHGHDYMESFRPADAPAKDPSCCTIQYILESR